jgi:hypothetical protein
LKALSLSVQGLAVQGLAVQGLAVQGLSVQGLSVQGLSVQGLSVQGLSVQGLAVQHAQMCNILNPFIKKESYEVAFRSVSVCGPSEQFLKQISSSFLKESMPLKVTSAVYFFTS